MSSLKQRILAFAKYKGLRKGKIAYALGMSYSSFRGNALERPINSAALEKLIEKYPELSADWLLTGKGYMLRVKPIEENDNKITELTTKSSSEQNPDEESIVESLREAKDLAQEAKAAYKQLAQTERELGETKERLAKAEAALKQAQTQRIPDRQKGTE